MSVLEASRRVDPLRRRAGQPRRQRRRRRVGDRRRHRPQRRRQDDAVQPDHRLLHARQRAHPLPRPRHHRTCRCTSGPPSGSGARSRTSASSRAPRCATTCSPPSTCRPTTAPSPGCSAARRCEPPSGVLRRRADALADALGLGDLLDTQVAGLPVRHAQAGRDRHRAGHRPRRAAARRAVVGHGSRGGPPARRHAARPAPRLRPVDRDDRAPRARSSCGSATTCTASTSASC